MANRLSRLFIATSGRWPNGLPYRGRWPAGPTQLLAGAAAAVAAGGTLLGGALTLPSAPAFADLITQGGPNISNIPSNVNTAMQNLQFGAATPGSNPIDHYRIYRNGVAYDVVSSQTSFTGYISGTTLTVVSAPSIDQVRANVRYACSNNAMLKETMVNAIQLSGTTGGVGTYRVNRSQTIGSSGAPVTFSAWQYTDAFATGAIHPAYDLPDTVYVWGVSAVDSQGNEGPITLAKLWFYKNGQSNTNNADLNFGTGTMNYSSASGNPQGSDFCAQMIKNPDLSWQPTVDTMMSTQWTRQIGGMNYLVFDFNPGTISDFRVRVGAIFRFPPGDVFGWFPQPTVINADGTSPYGPTALANTWGTYKVPLSVFGCQSPTQFHGSISGSTLTVTSVDTPGGVVDAGAFITGVGVPAGTFTSAYNQGSSIGTFPLSGPGIPVGSSIASEVMQSIKSNLYKFQINALVPGTIYFNNVGFSPT